MPPFEVFLCIIGFISDVQTFKTLWGVCHNAKRACEHISKEQLKQYMNTPLYIYRQVYDVGRRSPGPPDYDSYWWVSEQRPQDLNVEPRGIKPIIFMATRQSIIQR